MFKLVPNLTCWWPVKVMEPDPNKPGGYVEYDFEVEFIILNREDLKAADDARNDILKMADRDSSDEGLRRAQLALDEHDMKSFRRVLKNWRGVLDENDRPLPFDENAFLSAMKHDRIRTGINRAYQEAISQDKARLGN